MAVQTKLNWHPQSFLRELDGKLKRKEEQAAKLIETNAKSFAPVDTGALRDSIKAEKAIGKLEWIIKTDGITYALAQEFGTRFNSPKAYMRRGLSASIGRIRRIFRTK